MLGLRKNPLSRRKRDSSDNKSTEDLSATAAVAAAAMAALNNGSQGSLQASSSSKDVANTTPTITPSKPRPEPTAGHGHDDQSVQSAKKPEMHALTIAQPVQLPKPQTAVKVSDVSRKVRCKVIDELEHVSDAHFDSIDLEAYLEYLADERLVHMPARGSQWDRVLKEAGFFGIQLDEFVGTVQHFVKDSTTVRDTALASCYLLLELGSDQAEALEPTFNALYELGLLLAHIARLRDFFTATDAITQDLINVLTGLVSLVGDVAIYYLQRVNRMSGSSSVTIDFDAEFGTQINRIWQDREHLLDHMWTHSISRSAKNKRFPLDISPLRRKLAPSEGPAFRESAQSLIYGRVAERSARAQGTCEWLEQDLLEFLGSGDHIFTVTGSGGCGKSMLATWTRERLERRVGDLSFETISYTFAGDSPSTSTSISFLKSMLYQLLDTNVGDVRLFEKLCDIFSKQRIDLDSRSKHLEAELWEALDAGLAAIDAKGLNLVVIVDGFDEIHGGAAKAAELHKRLHSSVCKLPRVQAVTFSRPVSHLGGSGVKQLVISPDHVHDDIEVFVETRLALTSIFAAQKDEQKQQALVKLLASRAKGSFLFACIALDLIQCEGVTFDGFQKVLSGIKPDVREILDELLKKVNLKESKTSHLLSFVLAAERPLTIGEMGNLLSVNLPKRTIADVDAHAFVRGTHGLVVEHRGALRFRHSIVRKYILDLCGASSSPLVSIKDAHRLLTTTLLFFAKSRLGYSCEPSLELGANADLFEHAFRSYPVVEYLMRHWVTHFRASSYVGQKGELILSAEFKEVFPDSTFFALAEFYAWKGARLLASEEIQLHELTLRIRTATFGEKHRSVLQVLIGLGNLHRGPSSTDVIKAAEFYYRASVVGQAVLYKFSPIVVSCTNIFLSLTETVVFTQRTVLATYREEMIRFMIEICRVQHGEHSDEVIRWYKLLAKLYVSIREEQRASVVYRELHRIITIRFGRDSSHSRGVAEALAGLKVVLKKEGDGGPGPVETYDELLFEASEQMEAEDELRVAIIIRLAHGYELQGRLLLAEKLFVGLWHRISEACRLRATLELHLIKINVALEYVAFLRRIKRTEEACGIVICLWAEYEHHDFDSQAIIVKLRELAVLVRTLGLLSIAVSILRKVWGWFKSKKLTEHEDAASTTIIVSEVVEEITETYTETTTTTTVTETLTREVWETSYTRCKGGKVDGGFFKAGGALINLYLKLKKWSEAESVIRKSLEITWKGVLTVDAKLTIEGTFISERILVATNLALCYHHQRRFDKAEEIYVRIYRACLGSLHADDACLLNASLTLISFYEEYHRHDKAVEVYVQLLAHYRKHLSSSHQLTVKILYKLAALYMLQGRKEAYEYYGEIVAIFTKDGCCQRDALDAALILLDYYHTEQRWAELQKICAVLWATFVHHHGEIGFSEETVHIIYERYRLVLEVHAKVEFSVVYKLTIEYRETATKVWGAGAAVVVKILLALAELCETQEAHRHEAVTIYEELITRKTTTTVVTETTVRTVKKRLSKLYVTIITDGKTKTTSGTVERGIAVCAELYAQLQVELGWWHETTLLKLRELVLMYKHLGTKEAHGSIVKVLQVSVLHIVATCTTSKALHAAATTLASIYVAAGMARHGLELLRQLRLLLLLPGFDAGADLQVTIQLPATKKSNNKVTLVFLIAFEHGLSVEFTKTNPDVGFSEMMADLLLEMVLYEQYAAVMATLSEKTSIEVVLQHASRLRVLWSSRPAGPFVAGLVAALDKRVFALFTARYAQVLGPQHAGDSAATFELYAALLDQLGAAPDRGTTEGDQQGQPADFALAACRAANAVVKKLLLQAVSERDKKQEAAAVGRAHAVARCAFQFCHAQRFYHDRRRVVHGYRLAALLAGVDVSPQWNSLDPASREAMLGTSRGVLQMVLAVLYETKFDVTSLRRADLAGLVRLLGAQRGFVELERLLLALWRSREVQRRWSADGVLQVGALLVDAHVLAGHADIGLQLVDTLYYNVRQSRGGSDATALSLAGKLAALLRRAGRVRDESRLHRVVLGDLDVHVGVAARVSAEEKARLRGAADFHLAGLRACVGLGAGLEGLRPLREAYARLGRAYGNLTVPPVEKWAAEAPATPAAATEARKKAAASASAEAWVGPSVWELDVDEEGEDGDQHSHHHHLHRLSSSASMPSVTSSSNGTAVLKNSGVSVGNNVGGQQVVATPNGSVRKKKRDSIGPVREIWGFFGGSKAAQQPELVPVVD